VCLQWTFNSSNTFFPYNAPFAPAILRGNAPGAERVVTLDVKDSQWQVSALDIVSGTQFQTFISVIVSIPNCRPNYRSALLNN
jgi:hypothetical protein